MVATFFFSWQEKKKLGQKEKNLLKIAPKGIKKLGTGRH